MVDERWTTEAAQSALDEAGRTGRKGRAVRDQVAAQLILQSWFEEPVDPNEITPDAPIAPNP
jgi:putative Holliday junction resolvase